MREALTILSSKLLIASLLIIGIIALIVGRLRRRLRIAPDQANRAPLLWLVNVTADARLHRRFRALARRARAAARGGSRHQRRRGRTKSQRLAVDLQDELLTLDERLIDSRSLDFDRQRVVIRELRAEAKRMDGLIDRVTVLVKREAKDPSATLSVDPIGELAERVDQLEQAADIDADTVIEASAHTATSDAPSDGAEPTEIGMPSDPVETTAEEAEPVEPLDSPR